MLLLIDAGNTRLKWALAQGDYKIVERGVTSYELLTDTLRRLAANQLSSSVLVGIAISSVSGEERGAVIVQACQECFGVLPVFAQVSKTACGVNNDYHALDRLGVDRWVAALGLAGQGGTNRIIVDAGTAVTIDLLDAENVFLGGVILPGTKLMHDCLVGETAGIHSQRAEVNSAIGKTTDECVNAGVKYGLGGAVDRVIDEFTQVLESSAAWQVVVCGGDAAWLSGVMKTELPISVSVDLIFNGLLAMYESEALK